MLWRRAGFAALAVLAPGGIFAQQGVDLSQRDDERRLINVARAAIVAEVRGQATPPLPSRTSPRPVFVTIELAGVVRGCRGDLIARTRSLEEEVALAARAAAAHDPRYPPLALGELPKFTVTVTVVDRTEPIASVQGLLPDDGLILRSGNRTGIVLPWEGKDPQVRLDWAYRKAGIGRGASVSAERMIARRFRG